MIEFHLYLELSEYIMLISIIDALMSFLSKIVGGREVAP